MLIFGQEVGNRIPVYQDDERRIAFISNPNDGPDGYNVLVGTGYFVLPSRVLSVIAKPEYSTRDVMNSLTAVSPIIPNVLSANRITPDQLHIALLKVRQRELEQSLDSALERLT